MRAKGAVARLPAWRISPLAKEDPRCPTSAQPTGFTRYSVLIGAIMIQLILGTVYGYSIFWEPLSSEVFPKVVTEAAYADLQAAGEVVGEYKVVADEAEAAREIAVSQGYLKYAFSICILTFALVMVVAGRIQDLKGPRFPAIIGAILMGSGFLLGALLNNSIVFFIAHAVFAGFVCLVALMLYHALFGHLDTELRVMARYGPIAIATTVIVAAVLLGNQYVGRLESLDRVFLLWGTIGFVVGAGIGFAYVCPIAALVKWFPRQKGLVSGLAVAGFGFGAYLFSREYGALGFIREFGIVPFFVVHGLVSFVIVTLGALLLKNPPSVAKPAAGPSPAGATPAAGRMHLAADAATARVLRSVAHVLQRRHGGSDGHRHHQGLRRRAAGRGRRGRRRAGVRRPQRPDAQGRRRGRLAGDLQRPGTCRLGLRLRQASAAR